MTDKEPTTLDEALEWATACAERAQEIAEHVETTRDKLTDVEEMLTPWSKEATLRLREYGEHESKADVQIAAKDLSERVIAKVVDLDEKISELLDELGELAQEAEELYNEVEEAKG